MTRLLKLYNRDLEKIRNKNIPNIELPHFIIYMNKSLIQDFYFFTFYINREI